MSVPLSSRLADTDRGATIRHRVAVADDHPLYRDMLAAILNRDPDLEVLPPVSSYPEALAVIEAARPALALLDLDMPGMDDDGIARIRACHPETRLAIVSGSLDAGQVRLALRRGACGYLPKTLRGEMILAAAHLMLAGAIYVPPEALAEELSAANADRLAAAQAPGTNLTSRELLVLRLFTGGMGNKEIAHRLGLSAVTIKLCVRSILEKLKVRNRTAAAAAAVRCALVSIESPRGPTHRESGSGSAGVSGIDAPKSRGARVEP